MTREEANYYATCIDDAVRGKWVTVSCRDYRAAKMAFRDALALCQHMGLAVVAYRSTLEIVVADDIRDGGIDFRTREMEARRCGDPRVWPRP